MKIYLAGSAANERSSPYPVPHRLMGYLDIRDNRFGARDVFDQMARGAGDREGVEDTTPEHPDNERR